MIIISLSKIIIYESIICKKDLLTFSSILLDFGNYIFEKGYKKFKGLLFDLNGQELSRETNKIFCKDSNIVIFVLNMHSNEIIDEIYISQIKSYMNK